MDPLQSLQCLQTPTFIVGGFFYCFSWNITFENSIFIQKRVNPREFNDEVIHINCKFVDFLLKPTLKSLYVRRRLPGQQKFIVQWDGVHYHTAYSVTKYLNENGSDCIRKRNWPHDSCYLNPLKYPKSFGALNIYQTSQTSIEISKNAFLSSSLVIIIHIFVYIFDLPDSFVPTIMNNKRKQIFS